MTAILRLLARLPLAWLHRLGAALGWAAYLLSARYRRHLDANLAQAGIDDPHVRRAAIAEAGKAVAELPAIWLRPHAEVAGWVREVRGRDIYDEAAARGKGVLFLTPHLGCFDVTAQFFSHAIGPITVLYRPARQPWLRPLMEAGRNRPNMRAATTDVRGVRALVKALRAGEAIGMLPDQVPSRGEGEWAEFFGRPAYTMTLAARLAESTGAAIVLAYGERLPGGAGYRMHVARMPEALAGERPARRINRAMEGLIRERPEQYLWAYHRYKVPAGVAPPAAPG
ncbi:MAG: lysophospholipid acyltransferase family protein [Burkholderiales bacterium]|nr:lysophospholipid acyltransferase family protein [Burkholderiales bacterium]